MVPISGEDDAYLHLLGEEDEVDVFYKIPEATGAILSFLRVVGIKETTEVLVH